MEIKKRSSLAIQRDVIFALFLRELRVRFGTYKLGICWAFIEPVAFITVLTAIRTAGFKSMGAQTDVHGIPFAIFFMLGFMLYSLFQKVSLQASDAINANRQLFAYRQVRVLDAVLARVLLESIIWLSVIVILTLGLMWLGMNIQMVDFLRFLSAVFGLLLVGFGLGVFFCVVKQRVREMEKVLKILMAPMLFISGVFFSLDQVPAKYRGYLDWNPVLHAIELAREAAYGSYSSIGVSMFFLYSCGIALTFLGLATYRLEWRRIVAS
jgi:capsular polysaccharide transport system permease protein